MTAEALTRTLLGLPTLELRVRWLERRLATGNLEQSARALDVLAGSSDGRSREALFAVVLLLVRPTSAPLLKRLRSAAESGRLFSLDRLVRRTPPRPELAGEPGPVPDYGAGRELTLGERRSLARRPDRRAFEKLLTDPHPLVIHQLLQNPKLTENDVVRLVARRPARRIVLEEIAKAPRWLGSSRVRMAVLLNPGSPAEMALPLLAVCTRSELREVAARTDTDGVLRAAARELLRRHPPFEERAPWPRVLQ
jgi:hypothetical protein